VTYCRVGEKAEFLRIWRSHLFCYGFEDGDNQVTGSVVKHPTPLRCHQPRT